MCRYAHVFACVQMVHTSPHKWYTLARQNSHLSASPCSITSSSSTWRWDINVRLKLNPRNANNTQVKCLVRLEGQLYRDTKDPNFEKNKKIYKKLIKHDGFDQNGGRHEIRHKKMMHFDPGDVDFRATATRFVNSFVFLLFLELSSDPKVQKNYGNFRKVPVREGQLYRDPKFPRKLKLKNCNI